MHLVCASGVGWLHAYVYIIRTDGIHRLSGPMGPLSAILLRRPHIYCSNTARASSAWLSSTAFCLLIILWVWSRPVRQEECWPRVSTLVFDDETVPQGATGSNAPTDLLEMCDTWADRKEVGWLGSIMLNSWVWYNIIVQNYHCVQWWWFCDDNYLWYIQEQRRHTNTPHSRFHLFSGKREVDFRMKNSQCICSFGIPLFSCLLV